MKNYLLLPVLFLIAILPLKSDFIKNDDIFRYSDGRKASNVLFKTINLNGSVYITETGISLVTKRYENDSRETHRVNINFQNADLRNFSGTESDYNITYQGKKVNHYSEIIFEEIYPYIDLKFYTTEQKEVEFDFILKENSNPDLIKISVEDSEGFFINENDEIEIYTKISPVKISAPNVYNIVSGKKINVSAKYTKSENLIKFNINEYDRSKKLIIDPITRFSGSYYGGNGNDTGYDVVYDSKDNYYITGFTESFNNIAFNGYQMSLGGLEDAYLTKFDSDGERVWATYYGDMVFEVGYGVTVDPEDNVILVGETSSDANIATQGAHQTIYGGGTADGFIAKFNEFGTLLWATYYGGEDEDKINSVVTDQFGNIYAVGFTLSQQNISFNGFQQLKGGIYDAFVVKFNPLGDRSWGTYYGGTDEDYGNDIDIDANRNIYIIGNTKSTNAIASNGYQNTLSGGTDAFFTKFDTDGNRIWSSYFGGPDNEQGNGININNNLLYLAGATKSISNIAFNGYQVDHGGLWDGFAAKFDTDVNFYWSTYLGDAEDDFLNGVHAASNNNIYFTGSTASLNNVTKEAWQSSYSGGSSDGLFSKFTESGELEWSTYYGGSSRDVLRNSYFEEDANVIQLVGFTSSSNKIYDKGFQQNYGGNLDALTGKMSESELFANTDSIFCADRNYSVDISFLNFNFSDNNEFIFEISDETGSLENSRIIGRKTSKEITNLTITIPDDLVYYENYKVRIRSTDPAYTGKVTAETVTIIPVPEIITIDNELCQFATRNFTATQYQGTTLEWEYPGGNLEEELGNGVKLSWDEPGQFPVRLIRKSTLNENCTDTAQFIQRVYELPTAVFEISDTVCQRQDAILLYTKEDNVDYNWSLAQGLVTSDDGEGIITIQWNSAGRKILNLVAENSISGCRQTFTDTIFVGKTPVANIAGADESCKGCTETYNSTSQGDNSWSVDGGSILVNNNSNIQIQFESDIDTAYVYLTILEEASGCFDTDTLLVILNDNPVTSITGLEEVCEFTEYEYNASNGDLVNNSWEVQGGQITDERPSSIKVTWGPAGSGSIKLIQEGKQNTFKDSSEIDITINEKPSNALLTVSEFEYCENDTSEALFSVNNEYNYEIIATGVELISTNQIKFLNSGNQEVNILITNSAECILDTTFEFTIYNQPLKPMIIRDENELKVHVFNKAGTYYWYKDGKLYLKTDFSILELEEDGIYSVIFENENGCFSERSDELEIKLNSVSDIVSDEIRIYPNPAKNILNITSDKFIRKIDIVDILGNKQLSTINGNNIDISQIENGVYFVKIMFNDKLLIKKIIIE